MTVHQTAKNNVISYNKTCFLEDKLKEIIQFGKSRDLVCHYIRGNLPSSCTALLRINSKYMNLKYLSMLLLVR